MAQASKSPCHLTGCDSEPVIASSAVDSARAPSLIIAHEACLLDPSREIGIHLRLSLLFMGVRHDPVKEKTQIVLRTFHADVANPVPSI